MRYITEAEVQELLPMRKCIGLMRAAFERLARGEAVNQPRRRVVLPAGPAMHYMGASDGRYFGIKVYCTQAGHPPHFRVLLYRAENAELLALIEANYLGQIRTGAVSGLATQLLARPNSRTAAIIGSGFQARSQVDALLTAMPIKMLRVWSRSEEKRKAFARECSIQFAVRVEASPTAEHAIRGADVVITATNSRDPVLESEWVGEGTHVNAMGSNQAKRRELPADLVTRAGLIVVDSQEQSRMEAGDLLMALGEDDWHRTVELTEVVAGRTRRDSETQITLFKSNGLAVEDVIAAGFVYEQLAGKS